VTNEVSLDELVLMTLSFFEPMTFSQIILDFDSDKLANFPNFNKQDLEEIINKLEKQKLLKRVTIDKEIGWMRIQRKRSWFKRLLNILPN
jgi:DNA-directed RNA polymerase alpha subunit